MIVFCGYNNEEYQAFVRRYAESLRRPYKLLGLRDDFWRSADILKRASFAFIYNGRQHNGPLATELCARHRIPHAYMEWGFLPQSESFIVDPAGCGKSSILMRPLSWVTETDFKVLALERERIQARYPLAPEGFVLVPLQIENDTSVLYHTPFRSMDEFIEQVEAMYPGQEVVIRPHPKSTATRKSRLRLEGGGTFLDWARRASAVVGLTSTSLVEAAILGVPVVAMGECPLREQPRRHLDRLLAGYLALRVNRKDGDPTKILERFGLCPLD